MDMLALCAGRVPKICRGPRVWGWCETESDLCFLTGEPVLAVSLWSPAAPAALSPQSPRLFFSLPEKSRQFTLTSLPPNLPGD